MLVQAPPFPLLPERPEDLARALSKDIPEKLLRVLLPLQGPEFNVQLVRHTLGYLARPNLGQRTKRQYLLELRRFWVHRGIDLPSITKPELVEATDLTALIGYVNRLATTPRREIPVVAAPAALRDGFRGDEALRPTTIRRRVAAVRGWLEYLVAARVLDRNPARVLKIPVPEAARRRHPAMTNAEVRRLLAALDEAEGLLGLRDAALLRLGLWCGLRRAELVSLRVGDVKGERSKSRVEYVGKGQQKHKRTLPEEHVMIPLRRYLRCRGPVTKDLALFARHGRALRTPGDPMRPGQVSRILERWLKRSGVSAKRIEDGLAPLTPHSLRATHITAALRKLPLHVVQKKVGHKLPGTTVGYHHEDDLDDDPSLLIDFQEGL